METNVLPLSQASIQQKQQRVLTLEQVTADTGAIDVASNVEGRREQREENGHENERNIIGGLTLTRENIVPQLPSVRHLQNTQHAVSTSVNSVYASN